MLLFLDSFDHLATADLLEKWTGQNIQAGSIVISPGTGRRGTASLRITSAVVNRCYLVLTPGTASGATCVLGCAVQLSALPSGGPVGIASVRDGSNAQVSLGLQADGLIRVVRGEASTGTVLGTTAAPLTVGTFTFLELRVVIHATAGTVDVRFNGTSVLALTGQNTLGSTAAAWSSLWLGATDGNGVALPAMDIDDLWLLDGAGPAPWNSFLGDCRVDAKVPTGAGASAQWAPSTGANWQNVDDIPPDDDATYNAASSAGLTDTFLVGASPSPGAPIYGVQHNLSIKKMDAGVCQVGAVVRQGGVDYVSADVGPTTAYTFRRVTQQANPATGGQWTEAAFNAAEYGYKRIG